MLTRRALVALIAAFPVLKSEVVLARKTGREVILQLQYPPPKPASRKPSAKRLKPIKAEIKHAREAIDLTPVGPRPIDIAQSFVDRYFDARPAIISQLPPPAPLNPLIAEFLKESLLYPQDDPIPWCAAFVNFCIRRNGGAGSASAWSQSFLPPAFVAVDPPKEGDLAVFTCFSASTGKNIGLGHVAFFKRFDDKHNMVVVGGNQAIDGHSSIISEKTMTMGDQPVRRRLDTGAVVSAMMRLNVFVRPH
ncbi:MULTISPECIES: CHAP domain-containing protein [unclassified Sinorhizobium]|uniref:CHAP domain-containing protein n=1 Tax=unclassified Sinorhizobium TaxID=2613772 RepID=UPI0035264F27